MATNDEAFVLRSEDMPTLRSPRSLTSDEARRATDAQACLPQGCYSSRAKKMGRHPFLDIHRQDGFGECLHGEMT